MKNRLIIAFLLGLQCQSTIAGWDLTSCEKILAGYSLDTNKLVQHAEENAPIIRDQFMDFLSIPSTVDDERHLAEAARFISILLENLGLKVELDYIGGTRSPYVYAATPYDPNKPTVLFFSDYGVIGNRQQHAVEPRRVGQKLYGRGSVQSKGGIALFVAAIEPFLEGARLPVNIKMVIGGETYAGSPGLKVFIEANPTLFNHVDVIINTASGQIADHPTLTISHRGILIAEVHAQGLEQDIHSGTYGGIVPNPTNALAVALGKLIDVKNGRMNIPELYEDAFPPFPAELQSSLKWGQQRYDDFIAQAQLVPGVTPFSSGGEDLLSLKRLPAISIVSLTDAENNPYRTAIPASAKADLQIRIPPGVTKERVLSELKLFFTEQIPWGLKVEVISEEECHIPAWSADPKHPFLHLAGQAMQASFEGREVIHWGDGATNSIYPLLEKATRGAPILSIGLAQDDSNYGLPDENLDLIRFKRTRNGLIYYIDSFGHAKKH